jgi:hypothetical protein
MAAALVLRPFFCFPNSGMKKKLRTGFVLYFFKPAKHTDDDCVSECGMHFAEEK